MSILASGFTVVTRAGVRAANGSEATARSGRSRPTRTRRIRTPAERIAGRRRLAGVPEWIEGGSAGEKATSRSPTSSSSNATCCRTSAGAVEPVGVVTSTKAPRPGSDPARRRPRRIRGPGTGNRQGSGLRRAGRRVHVLHGGDREVDRVVPRVPDPDPATARPRIAGAHAPYVWRRCQGKIGGRHARSQRDGRRARDDPRYRHARRESGDRAERHHAGGRTDEPSGDPSE